MQAYRQMLENCSDVENFHALLHYILDYKWLCLLQSFSIMKAIEEFQRLKKKKNNIFKAEQEKLFNLSGIQHGFMKAFLHICVSQQNVL